MSIVFIRLCSFIQKSLKATLIKAMVDHEKIARVRELLNYATPQEEFFKKMFGVDCALQG